VLIPEFQSFATVVGQNISGALADKLTVEQALKDSQAAVGRAVKQAGYQK
jgi:sorbitol/mannitol transport system substrate-binding protein